MGSPSAPNLGILGQRCFLIRKSDIGAVATILLGLLHLLLWIRSGIASGDFGVSENSLVHWSCLSLIYVLQSQLSQGDGQGLILSPAAHVTTALALMLCGFSLPSSVHGGR